MVCATRFTYGTNQSHSVGCWLLMRCNTRVSMKVLPEPVGLRNRQGGRAGLCSALHMLVMMLA